MSLLRRTLPRPLAGAHWTLFAALLTCWVLLLLQQPCREGPRYHELFLIVSTVLMSLWVNHVRHSPLHDLKGALVVIGRSLYDLLLLSLSLAIVGLPVLLIMPAYQCYSPRAKVGEMVMSLSPLRAEVGSRLVQAQTLTDSGAGRLIPISDRVAGGLVTAEGVIVVVSEDPPAAVVFTPTLANGTVSWTCSGFPERLVPTTCRP